MKSGVLEAEGDITAKFLAVFSLGIEVKEYSKCKPDSYYDPLLPYKCRGKRCGNNIQKCHKSGHDHCHGSNKAASFYLIRPFHLRFLFSENTEGNRYEHIGNNTAKRCSINQPYQNASSKKRRCHTGNSAEDNGCFRRFVFSKLSEHLRDHQGFTHGIQGTASTHQERVPGCDDST